MRRSIGVIAVLLSIICLPDPMHGQQGGVIVGTQEPPESGFALGVNYPNPFATETRIPFELFERLFAEGRPAVVSIRVFDILRQYVASPTTLGHPAGDGTPVIDLEYMTPGRHEAYWDGLDRSGRPVSSGVYILELTVNGRSEIRRVFVSGE
jgi:hypothetical protein